MSISTMMFSLADWLLTILLHTGADPTPRKFSLAVFSCSLFTLTCSTIEFDFSLTNLSAAQSTIRQRLLATAASVVGAPGGAPMGSLGPDAKWRERSSEGQAARTDPPAAGPAEQHEFSQARPVRGHASAMGGPVLQRCMSYREYRRLQREEGGSTQRKRSSSNSSDDEPDQFRRVSRGSREGSRERPLPPLSASDIESAIRQAFREHRRDSTGYQSSRSSNATLSRECSGSEMNARGRDASPARRSRESSSEQAQRRPSFEGARLRNTSGAHSSERSSPARRSSERPASREPRLSFERVRQLRLAGLDAGVESPIIDRHQASACGGCMQLVVTFLALVLSLCLVSGYVYIVTFPSW